MNYQEFLNNIKTQISACVDPDVRLMVQSMPRNNGTSYDGLILLQPGRNVAPTIYLTPYYHRYLEGVTLTDICSDILDVYQKQLPDQDFDTTLFTDFERAGSKLIMRLVNYRRNEHMLSGVPHVRLYDLAIIFYCLLHADKDNQASILVCNDHLNLWNIDQDTLYDHARQNTPVLLPQQITPMHTLLEGFADFDPDAKKADWDVPMYVISNCYRTNGATALLYEQLLHQLAEQLQSNLMLLPSSIHEFLALPVENDEDLDTYSRMVCEVNETQLTDDEVLSDHAYYYDRTTQCITM